MTYSFDSLSPADFEDLVLDLIGRSLAMRFEAFAIGPDNGIDGRHSKGAFQTILQAKHYVRSTWPALKSALKKERSAIEKLNPDRYVLATSRALTPENKTDIIAILGHSSLNQSDIFSQGDLNGILRDNPDIEKSHIKLWLSSTAVLERIINAASHTHNAIVREELEEKIKVYAENPSLGISQRILEEHHVLIVSGPPGVGKTTLAQMLAYAYIADGWEFIAIRSLTDGLAALAGNKKQIFFFDDFLGKIALDAQSLAARETDLFNFVRKVQKSANCRFILTTRAYILEDARRLSEQLSSKIVQVSKFVLDVGIYTRRIKARILYNHLLAMAVPKLHIEALISSKTVIKLIDHKNYNPRIIEDMTDRLALQDVSAEHYPVAFIEALDNPHRIWDHAFRTHISHRCRDLVYSLYFASEHGDQIEDLREFYNQLHARQSDYYGRPYEANDFEEALRTLEGSFVYIRGQTVSFVNPSVRDYLSTQVSSFDLLSQFASSCKRARTVRAIWNHAKRLDTASAEQLAQLAASILGVVDRIVHNPQFKPMAGSPSSTRSYDLDCADRFNLILELWAACRSNILAAALEELTKIAGHDEYWWANGGEIVDIIVLLRDGTYESLPNKEQLAVALERSLIHVLQRRMSPDDLETTFDHIDEASEYLSDNIADALTDAVQTEIENANDYLREEANTGSIDTYSAMLRKMGEHLGIPDGKITYAEMSAKSRIDQLENEYESAEAPDIPSNVRGREDRFSDSDIRNLFASLATRP